MFKTLIILSLLFFLGCGSSVSVEETYVIDDRLLSIVREFESHYDTEVKYDVLIVNEQLTSNTDVVGTCVAKPNELARVRIELPFWNRYIYARRRALVFHELAHCSFGVPHDDREWDMKVWNNQGDQITYRGPYSIMHPTLFADRFYMDPFFSRHYVPQLKVGIEEAPLSQLMIQEFQCSLKTDL